jgi:hypothetical protein
VRGLAGLLWRSALVPAKPDRLRGLTGTARPLTAMAIQQGRPHLHGAGTHHAPY